MAYLPNGAAGTESYETFIEAAPLSHYIFDRPFVFFPVQPGANVNNSLVSAGTGTPAVAEINTSEINGITFDANDESFALMWMPPEDIDLAQAITLSAFWSNSQTAATGSGQINWAYGAITAGTDAIAVPATTTGLTNGATQADLGANIPQWSTNATIAASTFSDVPGDSPILLKCACTLTTITDMTIYMLRLRYYRKYLK